MFLTYPTILAFLFPYFSSRLSERQNWQDGIGRFAIVFDETGSISDIE
jgi:hypothetical protein